MIKKFEQFNNNQNKVTSDLNKKSQELKPIFTDKHDWKSSKIISETDWITTTPLISSSDKTTVKNQLLPQSVSINQSFIINLPTNYIPFLQTDIIIKTPLELQVAGVLQYNRATYEGDYFEVYGNGTDLIYKGSPQLINYLYTQAQLDNGDFLESNTKKRYTTSIEYVKSGSDWKFSPASTSSNIVRFIAKYNVSGQDYDEIDVYTDPNFVSSRNTDKILSLDETSFEVIGSLKQVRYVPTDIIDSFSTFGGQSAVALSHNPANGASSIEYVKANGADISWTFAAPNTVLFDPLWGGEIVTVKYQYLAYSETNTLNQQVLVNWTNVSTFQIRQYPGNLYKKILGSWVLQSSGDLTFDSSLVTSVTSKSFTFRGYWLFYEPSTKYLFGIQDSSPVVHEGSFHKKELYNLPQHPNRDWNTILFTRNPSPHPESIISTVISKSEKQTVISSLFPNDANPNKFKLFLSGTIILQSQALEAESLQYPVYNDLYTKSGTNPGDTYSVSESHTLSIVPYYRGQSFPIEYKLRVSLINPYDFSDRKNYEL